MNRPIDPDLDHNPRLDGLSREDLESQLRQVRREFAEEKTENRQLRAALKPFAEAAAKADAQSEESKRLLGTELGPDASPGWGIKRIHLDTARHHVSKR